MRTTLALLCLLLLSQFSMAGKKSLLDKDGVELFKSDKVYTLVNLHPDEARGLLYSTNYQLPSLLPRCTKVELKKISKKGLVFFVPDRGREYTYKYVPKHSIDSIQIHLRDFFGSKCNPNDVKKMSKADQEGIKQGMPVMGMTKKGVLMAMGRPPKHVNPTLDSDTWTYWRNKLARRVVTFDSKGKVTHIQ